MQTLPIKYLNRKEIDDQKWDLGISNAINALPYAYCYFLDNMAPEWSALIVGDYEVLMPLTWKKKWGIRYLYQPHFIQQLGIFSDTKISDNHVDVFMAALKNRFRFAEIFLNFDNQLKGAPARRNYILLLKPGYEQIRSCYKNDLLKNLRLTARETFTFKGGDLDDTLQSYQHEYKHRIPHVKSTDYEAFRQVCLSADSKNKLVIRSVTDADGSRLSSAVLINDAGRLILLLSVTSRSGRSRSANHYLIDQLIREFSGQDLVLDFEGSDIPGIAHFYSNFGATDQPYYFYRYNRLPWWVRLIKP